MGFSGICINNGSGFLGYQFGDATQETVSEFGVHKGGIYTCDYSTIKEFIDIQDVEFVNALSEAACLTFKEKYNSCLKNIVYLKNRNKVGSFSILK